VRKVPEFTFSLATLLTASI